MKEREEMYIDYKRELCAMDGVDGLRAPEDSYLNDVRLTVLRPDLAEWIPIEEDEKEVGFLLITKGELLKRGEDYRIEESYVKPEYRRRGLMTKTVKKYLSEHPGTYSFQLMVNNLDSAYFWFPLIGKRLRKDIIINAPNGEAETIDYLFDNKEDG